MRTAGPEVRVTTLTLPYVGEEAIYTIAAMEMKVRGEYFVNTLYGTNHGQPPLLNWLIILLADSFGWQHVLVASRLVAACATTAGSGVPGKASMTSANGWGRAARSSAR